MSNYKVYSPDTLKKIKKNRLKSMVNKPLISHMLMLTNKPQLKPKFFPNFNKLLEHKYVCNAVLAPQWWFSDSEQKCCIVLKIKGLNPCLFCKACWNFKSELSLASLIRIIIEMLSRIS